MSDDKKSLTIPPCSEIGRAAFVRRGLDRLRRPAITEVPLAIYVASEIAASCRGELAYRRAVEGGEATFLVDVRRGTERMGLKLGGSFRIAEYSPCGRYLSLDAGHELIVLDTEQWSPPVRVELEPGRDQLILCWSADRARFAVSYLEDSRLLEGVRVFELTWNESAGIGPLFSAVPRKPIPPDAGVGRLYVRSRANPDGTDGGGVEAMALQPSGRVLAVALGTGASVPEYRSNLALVSLEGDEETTSVSILSPASLTWVGDDYLLAVDCAEGQLLVLEYPSLRESRLAFDEHEVFDPQPHPSRPLVAAGLSRRGGERQPGDGIWRVDRLVVIELPSKRVVLDLEISRSGDRVACRWNHDGRKLFLICTPPAPGALGVVYEIDLLSAIGGDPL